jgi:hypothetical protein
MDDAFPEQLVKASIAARCQGRLQSKPKTAGDVDQREEQDGARNGSTQCVKQESLSVSTYTVGQ